MLEYQEHPLLTVAGSIRSGFLVAPCFLSVGTESRYPQLQATGENFYSLCMGLQVEKDLWDVWTLEVFLSLSGPITPFL